VHKDKYAAIMEAQIAAAAPLRLKDYSINSTELGGGGYCNTTLPPFSEAHSAQDLKLYYNNHSQYIHFAKQLAPMMRDISSGVSDLAGMQAACRIGLRMGHVCAARDGLWGC
jgi:hypothetical protein